VSPAQRAEPSGACLPCPARLNPFAVARTDRLEFRFPTADWVETLSRLKALGYRGAIRGPQGSGKTTLLEQTHQRLVTAGHHCWRTRTELGRTAQARQLQTCFAQPAGTILLIDSAEQLSRWNWWQLVRGSAQRSQGLVVTLDRPSCLLGDWVRTETTPELFLELLAELLPQPDRALQSAARAAFARHRGNLRAAFRELYDCFAGLPRKPGNRADEF